MNSVKESKTLKGKDLITIVTVKSILNTREKNDAEERNVIQ